MINVLFFGPVVERLGMRDCQIPCVEGMTLQCLHDQLAAIYPHAFEIVCFCAVNGWQVRACRRKRSDFHGQVFRGIDEGRGQNSAG